MSDVCSSLTHPSIHLLTLLIYPPYHLITDHPFITYHLSHLPIHPHSPTIYTYLPTYLLATVSVNALLPDNYYYQVVVAISSIALFSTILSFFAVWLYSKTVKNEILSILTFILFL